MGEAAEATDDVVVQPRPVERMGVAGPLRMMGEELDGAGLVARVLRMLEGKVEEGAERGLGRLIVAAGDGEVRGGQGQRVGGEGVGGAAVEVPRDLVGQQDEGQGGVRGLGPGRDGTARGFEVQRLDETGFVLVGKMFGQQLELTESLAPASGGTRMTVQMRLGNPGGLMTPVAMRIARRLEREKLEAWKKHNVEEDGTLQHFLPALFARYG